MVVNALSIQDIALEKNPIIVPLDHYRVLGIPLEATSEQIEQAYHDRSVQLPRAEYSHRAITLRQQIIRKSYQILSDPQQKEIYDQKLVAYPTPELSIEDTELVGALVILQELGEYILLSKLAAPYENIDRPDHQDIILSLAIADLELGREEWQQGKYQKAGIYLLHGQKLLTKNNLFLNLQEQIKQDLYKLRPYRILELLSLNIDQIKERRIGLNLLQDMLNQRGGIEGNGNDYSGLNLDDFLRFIQQIQSYLTVTEQQNIFEKEAKRPSPVATYLAFYALLARGFAHKKPELILQAKQLLKLLRKHQDIYLEKAVCHLLLGQTETALQCLEKSQESQTLNFIRKQCQDSDDLLPGLCLYSERWIQSEVFPHFRDLTDCTISLQEYFNDPEVQTYLNNLVEEKDLSYLEAKPNYSTPIEEVYSIKEQLLNASSLQTLKPTVVESQATDNVSMVEAIRESDNQTNQRSLRRKFKPPQFNSNLGKILLASLLGIGFLMIISNLWKKQSISNPQLSVSVNQPVLTIPEVEEIPIPVTPVSTVLLDTAGAQEMVEKWLEVKSRAFGKEHEINALSEILTGDFLAEREKIANLVKSQNSYREYEHSVQVESVEIDEQEKQAIVITQVRETARYYQDNMFLPEKSYNANLRLRYDLVQIDGKWMISNLEEIK